MAQKPPIAFRLPEHLLREFEDEAARRGFSVHEYAKQMALLGHMSLQNKTLENEMLLKSTVIHAMTLRGLAEIMIGEEKTGEIVRNARLDAAAILKNWGVD